MSYYRAALSAAAAGNLTEARELYEYSLIAGENPNSALIELIEKQPVRAHLIEGCRKAIKKRYRAAAREFAIALKTDSGCTFALSALNEVIDRRSIL